MGHSRRPFRINLRSAALWYGAVLILFLSAVAPSGSAEKQGARPLILAHYMPWFSADPTSGKWGWHWTMNGHFDPNRIADGRRQIAAHDYPIIGPYDSSDPDLAEYEVLLMKLAGIDGVLIDWDGTTDYHDFATNQRGAQAIVREIERAGMKFGVVYDDQSVAALVSGHVLDVRDAVTFGHSELEWLAANWFSSPDYVTLDGAPVLLQFGGNGGYFQGAQWDSVFSGLPKRPAFFTELGRNPPAIGGFGWPVPAGGTAASFAALGSFYGWYKNTRDFIACAYPRFDDIYAQAGLHRSWGHIDDDHGQTYKKTLLRAVQSGAPIVQIATWNDWGEGTQVEPSDEYGYRDLETTQRVRRSLDPSFPFQAADLRLPAVLYRLRKGRAGGRSGIGALDRASALLLAGKTAQAAQILRRADRDASK